MQSFEINHNPALFYSHVLKDIQIININKNFFQRKLNKQLCVI